MGFRNRAMIGGHGNSQAEREPAMRRFSASRSIAVRGGWKHQCRCGYAVGYLYRGRWWCNCGREQGPLHDYMQPCGCMLCAVLER